MPSLRRDEPPNSKGEQRIAKLLARAGIASRREIERMIADGRIALNGTAIDTPATLLRSLHGVTVDGQPVAAPTPARLFVYHKPVGLLVTERDPRGRPTIYDRLPGDLPRVVPVGRLDLNTEGLLLLTTDGGLKRQLELPASGVKRTYRARAYGSITQTQLEELIEGIEIEGVRYGSIDANLERRTGANVWIELTLTEGKNREVRRVLEHLGLSVSRLIRTRYGPFVLGDLPVGDVGEVRQHDLVVFRRTLDSRTGNHEDAPIAVSGRRPMTGQAADRTRSKAQAPDLGGKHTGVRPASTSAASRRRSAATGGSERKFATDRQAAVSRMAEAEPVPEGDRQDRYGKSDRVSHAERRVARPNTDAKGTMRTRAGQAGARHTNAGEPTKRHAERPDRALKGRIGRGGAATTKASPATRAASGHSKQGAKKTIERPANKDTPSARGPRPGGRKR